MTDQSKPLQLAEFYARAKRSVVEAGCGGEIAWQEGVSIEEVTESVFLREAAWVILATGMRESIIRRKFPSVSVAFFEWRSAKEIQDQRRWCRERALRCFNNSRKIQAILEVCHRVAREGFEAVHEALRSDGLGYIRQLPFMGPITSFHLAKNIGVPCAKPDRHLTRMAAAAGYEGVQEMCGQIAQQVGEKIAVVDLVLWRYATHTRDYLSVLRGALAERA